MRHSNIAVFIPHSGCPHQCSFCNQHTISGAQDVPTPEQAQRTIREAVEAMPVQRLPETEIAFFGGSFTALDREYMTALLEIAKKYVLIYGLRGIRFSTRPDAVNEDILAALEPFPVTAVELGAQCMNDEVLQKNRRGHTVRDVEHAVKLLKAAGYELGLQMMTGLYGASERDDLETGARFIGLGADTVRIYPTVVLPGTRLAKLFQAGKYRPPDAEESVRLCAVLMERFIRAGVRILKVGLHASEEVAGQMLAGAYHPAFRELCEGEIYARRAEKLIADTGREHITLAVHPSAVSKMVGQKRRNILRFEKKYGCQVSVVPNEHIPLFDVRLFQARNDE